MVLFDKLLIAGSIIALLINNSGLTQATGVVCPALRNPRNGMVNVVGTSAVYTCNPGYILLGGASVQCISGQWSSRPPTCVIFTVP
ncbi:membrane cofactor protein-like [Dysidea avara]|uniref:membrane cofactor protein-like n=1 Tax=Dysidea avara TaxID=196820 RepID=UPI00331B12B1